MGEKGQNYTNKSTPAATPSLVRLLNKRNEAARGWLSRSSQPCFFFVLCCPSVHRPKKSQPQRLRGVMGTLNTRHVAGDKFRFSK